jgi:beta-mannosidase
MPRAATGCSPCRVQWSQIRAPWKQPTTWPGGAPGDAHSALLAAGLIPDPYVGRNELEVRPLADRDWVASRTFQWEGEPKLENQMCCVGGITAWGMDFVYLSQVQQGLAMRTAIEYWRSLKPHCMGTLYWQLNDTWPVASWSGLDHGGGWKLMHYMARDFYAPIATFAIPSRDGATIAIMVVNDGAASASADIEVFAVSTDGARKDLGRYDEDLSPDRAIAITTFSTADIPEDAILHIWTSCRNGATHRHFAPRPYKSYAFAEPNIVLSNRSTDGALIIKVAAERPAYFVALECDVPGHFSDAAFDLLPGEPREVTFRPETPGTLAEAARTLIVRDLYSATCT